MTKFHARCRTRRGNALLVVTFLCVALSGCNKRELDELRGENEELRAALAIANARIEEAASSIDDAQALVGDSCRDLSDAVEVITSPEPVAEP